MDINLGNPNRVTTPKEIEKTPEVNKPVKRGILKKIDELLKQSIIIFLIIGFLSHYNLTTNYSFLVNRLLDKIYTTDEAQVFSIGDNCSRIIRNFYFFINWNYVSITFILLIGIFIFANIMLYYFPNYLLNRFICILYICFLFINIVHIFPICIYIFSPGFFSVLYFILRPQKHDLEDSVINSIKESCIFQLKDFLYLILPVIFLIIPFALSMLYFLYNLLLSFLLFNNKTNIANLTNLILSFILLKLITCFIKYLIIFMQHNYVKEEYINCITFKKSFKFAIYKTYEYCFFLILLKILTDIILRVLLFKNWFSVKFNVVFYSFLITFCLIQIATSVHKTILMSNTVIWEKFPTIFSFHNQHDKRPFYTGRNILFYFRSLKNDLFTKVIWNTESRVVLFHGVIINLIYILFTNFFKNFEKELLKTPDSIYSASSKLISNNPQEIFTNELCISYKKNVIRVFLLTPYLFLLFCTQTGLISSLIFRSWYFIIKDC